MTAVPEHPYDTDIAPAAALMADPTRAAILRALLPDRPLAAGELARTAGVSAATASFHLAKLLDGNMITVARQGRHRYYRLAGHEIAAALEAIGQIAAALPVRSLRQSREAAALAEARTCYDHLAGRLGVALADALTGRGYVELGEDGGGTTKRGEKFLTRWGIDLAEAASLRRSFCRPCLDWSERRPHIAGSLGARLADRCLELDWVRRRKDSRALTITRRGTDGFRDLLGIRLEA